MIFFSKTFLSGPTEPSLVDVALCYIADSPLSCVKEQVGRALDSWESQVEEKRHDLMGKCNRSNCCLVRKSKNSHHSNIDYHKSHDIWCLWRLRENNHHQQQPFTYQVSALWKSGFPISNEDDDCLFRKVKNEKGIFSHFRVLKSWRLDDEISRHQLHCRLHRNSLLQSAKWETKKIYVSMSSRSNAVIVRGARDKNRQEQLAKLALSLFNVRISFSNSVLIFHPMPMLHSWPNKMQLIEREKPTTQENA